MGRLKYSKLRKLAQATSDTLTINGDIIANNISTGSGNMQEQIDTILQILQSQIQNFLPFGGQHAYICTSCVQL